MFSKFIAAWSPIRLVSQQRSPMPSAVRMLGSKVAPGNPPGSIAFRNDQSALKIDEDRLIRTASEIRKLIGYETYDVTLILTDDECMQETNLESRGVDAPTDILSFPLHSAVTAGSLSPPDFDIPDYYTLGDILVDVPYVIRRCAEDRSYYEDDSSVSEEEDDERGVSKAMSFVYDPEERINMLLIHGMLHLVGFDHETDEDFAIMASREEDLLSSLGYLSSSLPEQ